MFRACPILHRTWTGRPGHSGFKKTIERYPNDSKAHAYLGYTYSQKGLVADAANEFQKAISINPALQKETFDFPMAKNSPPLLKEFIMHFKDIAPIIDAFSAAHETLGACYTIEGRLGDALNEYEKVLKLEPGMAGEIQKSVKKDIWRNRSSDSGI